MFAFKYLWVKLGFVLGLRKGYHFFRITTATEDSARQYELMQPFHSQSGCIVQCQAQYSSSSSRHPKKDKCRLLCISLQKPHREDPA